MDLSTIKPHTLRRSRKRVGRGGKRGTTSGHGTKGQKGRAGSSVRPGFRGGDNRIWQLFLKLRGASKKHGNSRPHRKHRFFAVHHPSATALNVGLLNVFGDGQVITSSTLFEKGLINDINSPVKILGGGTIKRKITIKDIPVSKSAAEKINSVGGLVQN